MLVSAGNWALRDLRADEVAACAHEVRRAFQDYELKNGPKNSSAELRFVSISTAEAPKETVYAAEEEEENGGSPLLPRKAFVVAARVDRGKSVAEPVEAVLRRTSGPSQAPRFAVESLEVVRGQQPPMMTYEYDVCEKLVRASDALLAIVCERSGGAVSLEQARKYVRADPWMNFFPSATSGERRLLRPMLFYEDYSRPLDGIDVVIDVVREEVVSVRELFRVAIPGILATGEPDTRPGANTWKHLADNEPDAAKREAVTRALRQDLKPLQVAQPEGVSFALDPKTGECVWQKWRFTIGFNAREGLILRNLSVMDDECGLKSPGRWRKVLWRASLSEMVVPYGELSLFCLAPFSSSRLPAWASDRLTLSWQCVGCPRFPNFSKNAFDAGEDGLGRSANSLKLGCDCLGHIQYLDAVLCDEQGTPDVLKNAICVHEEDFGLLWKHTDWRDDRATTRRQRRLVISFFATVANYDYGFYYHFYLDGTIELEIKLTGQLSTTMIADAQRESQQAVTPAATSETRDALGFVPTQNTPVAGFGTTLTPEGLYAPIHQHSFCVRLDWAVDGISNRANEVNVEPVPVGAAIGSAPDGNWHRAAFRAVETPLTSESAAKRQVNSASARAWKICNPAVQNDTGAPVAWKVIPGLNSASMPDASSLVATRAGFLDNNVWFTPYHDDELYASGRYMMGRTEEDGLRAFTRNDRNLDGKGATFAPLCLLP
jgi:primary-amine oxidase